MSNSTSPQASADILSALATEIAKRKSADPEQSYVAALFNKGQDAILKKVGEEAVETILAAKSGNTQHLVHETADLWFHCLVMLAEQNLEPDAILAELQRRFGVSGITEKQARNSQTAC